MACPKVHIWQMVALKCAVFRTLMCRFSAKNGPAGRRPRNYRYNCGPWTSRRRSGRLLIIPASLELLSDLDRGLTDAGGGDDSPDDGTNNPVSPPRLIRRRIVRLRSAAGCRGRVGAAASSAWGTRGPVHGAAPAPVALTAHRPATRVRDRLRDLLRPDRKAIQSVHRSGLPVSQHGARSDRAGAAHLNRHAPGRRRHHRTVRHRQDLAVPRRHRAARIGGRSPPFSWIRFSPSTICCRRC